MTHPNPEQGSNSPSPLQQEVSDRFGVLPNFFCLAPEAPEITANLWGFAKFGYLDNPLPPLFKERLFVYLSRFCDVRYCIARHVGFLVGLGRPAGDRACPPETVEQVVRLIRRALPRGEGLEPHLARLETCGVSGAALLESGTELEESVFACATHAFLQTPQMSRCLKVLGAVLDSVTLQHLMVFLAFVRTAHYWTKLHTELGLEDDVKRLLTIHQELAECVLKDPEAASSETAQVLLDELNVLRRDSAAALRESENRVRAVFDQAAVGIFFADLSGRLLEVNPRLCQILERNAEQLCGMTCEELTHPEDWARTTILMQEVAEDKRAEFTIENRYARNNDSWIWGNMAVTPLRDASGRVQQLLGVIEDIHARKRTEEKLREADRRKDEFLATLAHELRNPLAPIRNSLHLLRLSGDISPALDPVRDIMERQVDQMVRLIDDLLEVSRISSGKIELRKEVIELATIVSTAVETARPLIDEAGHQLALSLPAEPMILAADPMRLAQVIGNLLNNAAKYTKRGGQIWLTARNEGDEAMISIRDTGLGIPEDMLPRVFEMFAQVDRTLTRAQGGLGIGLTLTKTFVEMHGGRIEAHSDGANQGSTFVVYLPMMRDSQRRSPRLTPVRSGQTSYSHHRVLIVDDTRSSGYILGKLLETMGQKVYTATDATAALEIVRTEHPDLVISDIAMPGMDGYELAQRLRSEPGLENLLLVALTGYGQDSDKQRAKQAGFNYHLVKPVSLEALQDLLASVGEMGADRPDLARGEN